MSDDQAAPFWAPSISRVAGPVYLAIADALQADIRAGRLAIGARLPPQRALAEALGIDFTTVTRAYAEARKRGLVEGRVGQGTYVSQGRAAPPRQKSIPSGLVDMSMNLPPRFDDEALTARMWQGISGLEFSDGLDLLLRYQQPGGAVRDREAGAEWLASRLPGIGPERILVCPGAQGAILAITRMLTAPGDTVCAEALTYPGFLSVAAHLRLNVAAIETDDKGLIPEAFEEFCLSRCPKALYCNPTINNPTTITLPLSRRKAILDIAARYDVAVIEDDAYGALPIQPVAPLAALAPERVYHIAGLAKCLSPALRIAYLAVPDLRAATKLAGIIRATAAMASPLSAAIASRWIEDGTAEAVLAAIRQETKARQAIAAELLPAANLLVDPEGFHAWLRLPSEWSRGEFTARLRSAGIGVVASDAFALGPAPEAVRLGLGVAEDRDHLRQSLGIVADLLAETPAASAIVI
ncbi:PLP-dependent aminotransferase family protein [Rhizobium sp. CNPSo 3464]|uniref:aminotransferase-like domain-containing protein n=1 Tax=Rhizobium sp. CNPSo 3464 TaxID=3021406 RepID=UPI00254BA1F9|nr:PLP-dependent aminotransferase family protein [Rhizobium sp. CNPSo 3464]MDK4740161.1 PLP-dependent aminotransferase family protein [Rhizobium sp. CNPSo 3464]